MGDSLQKIAKSSLNNKDIGMKYVSDFELDMKQNMKQILKYQIEGSINKLDHLIQQYNQNNLFDEFKRDINLKVQKTAKDMRDKGESFSLEVVDEKFRELYREWKEKAENLDHKIHAKLNEEFLIMKRQCITYF